jgi:hypothetical protein
LGSSGKSADEDGLDWRRSQSVGVGCPHWVHPTD